MAAGARLVVLDRNPAIVGAVVTAVICVRGSELTAPSRWIDVNKDRQIEQESDIPRWWPGGPPPC